MARNNLDLSDYRGFLNSGHQVRTEELEPAERETLRQEGFDLTSRAGFVLPKRTAARSSHVTTGDSIENNPMVEAATKRAAAQRGALKGGF
jgi:hypothetical protein